MAWNPAQYLKFHGPRLRPALDLIQAARVMLSDPGQVRSILDLGCGPGNITQHLCEAFPQANVEGVDSSPEMIDKANRSSFPPTIKSRISFKANTIETLVEHSTQQYDLVYANASLHWCTGHETLIPSILQKTVKDNGGVLAVQMPDTIVQPSHTLMETAALRSGLFKYVENVRIPRTDHSADWYFKLLAPFCKEIEIWSTDYIQQLPANPYTSFSDGPNAPVQRHPVLEFTKSTGLLPLLEALGGERSEHCQKFLREYEILLTEQYPVVTIKNRYSSKGRNVVLMPFKRFFFVCKT